MIPFRNSAPHSGTVTAATHSHRFVLPKSCMRLRVRPAVTYGWSSAEGSITFRVFNLAMRDKESRDSEHMPLVCGVLTQDSLCICQPIVVGADPSLIRVVSLHGLSDVQRVRSQIPLIDDPVVADDEALDSRDAIFGRECH